MDNYYGNNNDNGYHSYDNGYQQNGYQQNGYQPNGYPQNGNTYYDQVNSFETATNRDEIKSKIITRSYIVMLVSLLITAFAATATAMDAATFYSMLNYAFKPLIIIEVLVAIGASYFIGKKNVAAAAVMYLAYTIMNGVTMSVIFYAFDLSSIQQVFLTTAILFGVMAGIGAVTKKDLTSLGSLLSMALIGVIIVSIFAGIFGYTGMDMAINYIVVFIFVGLTAYDAQKVKVYANTASESDINVLALYSGMQLYLDFINIFIRLLAIMGKRK
ncbi:MAG: Bax inhibitor-1/YccA family protein [Lachnospiraceae bacterium]|nr:Bax inhibitor-1/YccA family protein [Lachnospiraceae bacterium]